MNRLQSEMTRLYLPPAARAGAEPMPLIDDAGQVRALVLALSGPADWALLGKVWRGVQAELDLPAPAIAVSGSDALQLWFSLQQPVDAAQAAGFGALLAARYLPDVAAARLRCLPSAAEPGVHAPLVPAEQEATGNWSAFVAPDLAPVFADTPWLDIPPGIDGQADLLARLQPMAPAAFEGALHALQALQADLARSPAPPAAPAVQAPAGTGGDSVDIDPQRFLQQVLNDAAAPLALRVEAAKALLRQARYRPPGPGG